MLVIAAIKAQPPPAPWEQGLPVKVGTALASANGGHLCSLSYPLPCLEQVVLTPAVQGAVEAAVPVLMRTLERDEDDCAVAVACATLLGLLEALGPASLASCLPRPPPRSPCSFSNHLAL